MLMFPHKSSEKVSLLNLLSKIIRAELKFFFTLVHPYHVAQTETDFIVLKTNNNRHIYLPVEI